MTMEAFMGRGMERQRLLEGLLKDLLAGEARRKDPTFLFKIERVISGYLQQRRHNSPRHVPCEVDESVSFCADLILGRIREFGGSQIEDDALVAELLRKVVESATVHFLVELQSEESSCP